MIELPEAVVLSRQVTGTLSGRRILRVVANASPHKFAWFSGDPARYPDLLQGRTIQEAFPFGNHVEIHVDDWLLVLNTPIRCHPAGEKPPKKHQLYIEFEDGSAMSCTVQMWGGLFCFAKGEKGGMSDYHISKEKPSPLSDAFDRAYFQRLFELASGTLSAKEFLATEQRIPGLGNGVLQDILWTARIHPRQKLAALSGDQVQAMYGAVKHVLREMAELGGRDTERDLFGQPGGYKTILSKNTVGKPCPECGTKIKKEAFMGGSIYFCASCQAP
jgi:formamidopyrimidine-DNA glycosylase